MTAAGLKDRLRTDLKTAMRERDMRHASLIRTLIAAIDNAEAVPIDAMAARIRAREDVGEVPRREIDASTLDEILDREVASRLAAAEDYERHGRDEDAARLRGEAELIAPYRA
jgi:uncharacterized protein YqeY